MLLVIFCLIRPIYSLFAKADFPDGHCGHSEIFTSDRELSTDDAGLVHAQCGPIAIALWGW